MVFLTLLLSQCSFRLESSRSKMGGGSPRLLLCPAFWCMAKLPMKLKRKFKFLPYGSLRTD